MTEAELKNLRDTVAGMGDRTKTFIFVELCHDGPIYWRWVGDLKDALYLQWCLDHQLQDFMSKQLKKE